MKKTVLISILFVLGACSEKIETKINPSEIKISSSPKIEPTITPSIIASIMPSASIIPSPQKSSNSDFCCTTGDKMWAKISGLVRDKNGTVLSDYHVKIEIIDNIPNKGIYNAYELYNGVFLISGILIDPKEKVDVNIIIEKNNTNNIIYKGKITIFSNTINAESLSKGIDLNYFDIKLTE